MAGFHLGCGGTLDFIVDDTALTLVQDVVDLLDGLGHWIGYAPSVSTTGQPIYIEQEPLAA